jgi:hypothetical protein
VASAEASTADDSWHRFGGRERAIVGVGLAALTVITLLVRLPNALDELGVQAKKNASYTSLDRTLAAADSLDISNAFVGRALALLPNDSTFAVLLPSARSTRGISPLTVQALPGYLRYLLLPRRDVEPRRAEYLLCYGCDVRPWQHRVTWLWSDEGGLRIGRTEAEK